MSNRFRRIQPILGLFAVVGLLVAGVAFVFSSNFYEFEPAQTSQSAVSSEPVAVKPSEEAPPRKAVRPDRRARP